MIRLLVDYESHQRILFLFSRALINHDLVTSFVMNAIIIIVPSYIMRGYLGGIIYGDRSCCLMHQASWTSESAITYTHGSAVYSDVEMLLMENSFVISIAVVTIDIPLA